MVLQAVFQEWCEFNDSYMVPVPLYNWKSLPSSLRTAWRYSQLEQFVILEAKLPCTSPPHKVPANFQQYLPANLPPFLPSNSLLLDAGHTPSSDVFDPLGSLPHFFTSQQFFFIFNHPFCPETATREPHSCHSQIVAAQVTTGQLLFKTSGKKCQAFFQ